MIGCCMDSFRMVVVGGDDSYDKSCEVYSFKNDSWSKLPNLKTSGFFQQQLIVIDGMLIAGCVKKLEGLDLSAPELIYKLVHFAIELDVLCSDTKPSICKPPSNQHLNKQKGVKRKTEL